MTLVELLVVIAIIGLLSAAVLPNLAGSAGTRKVRETARSVSSFIAGVQSRSIGSRSGAGIWIDLLNTAIIDDAGDPHPVALDLSFCDMPTRYSGEVADAVVRYDTTVPLNPTDLLRSLEFGRNVPKPPPSDELEFLKDFSTFYPPNYSASRRRLSVLIGESRIPIRLWGPERFTNAPPSPVPPIPTLGPTGWDAQFNTGQSQTPQNTPWPVADSLGVPYEVILPPTKNPSRSLTIETEMAIDLRWTFFGNTSGAWPPCNSSSSGVLLLDAPVQLLYSATGKPSTVAINNQPGTSILEPFYLLVASIEAIQNRTAFTTSRSYWVAVDPAGGIPRVAEVNPPAPMPEGPWVPSNRTELLKTQKFIRDASLQTGG
jgi:prepilin-type N-terminal cleavage/methylation domain-containing protein